MKIWKLHFHPIYKTLTLTDRRIQGPEPFYGLDKKGERNETSANSHANGLLVSQ